MAQDAGAPPPGDGNLLGIGMVGYAFMGRAHSQAWRTVGHFFDLPRSPRMAAICGRDRAAVAAAADRAAARGVRAMVGFNFRRVPAVALARELVAAGRLGTVRQVRAAYLAPHAVDPAAPLAWRFRAEAAGSGALGDLGAHAVDLAQHVAGDRIAGVAALT